MDKIEISSNLYDYEKKNDNLLRKELKEFLDDLPILIGKKIYIWGTGNTAHLYQEGLKRLESEGLIIEAYVDNDSTKWGSLFSGHRIVSPDELQTNKNVCVLICSPQPNVIKSISNQLIDIDVEFYHIDEFIFKLHAQEIMDVFDKLDDDRSKEVYAGLIQARISGCHIKESLFCENQYLALPQFIVRRYNEVFVDCGAFVGDTIEQYIWKMYGGFKKIIAFEPDPSNFDAMKKRICRLQDEWNLRKEDIEVYPYALSDENSIKTIECYEKNNGLGSKVVDGICEGPSCQTITIDEMITEPFSFLKADIESYEYRMLLGARESIRKWKPRLAICIYHNAVDFYSIPLLVKSFVPEYKLAIRHHSFQTEETVLYAWID